MRRCCYIWHANGQLWLIASIDSLKSTNRNRRCWQRVLHSERFFGFYDKISPLCSFLDSVGTAKGQLTAAGVTYWTAIAADVHSYGAACVT